MSMRQVRHTHTHTGKHTQTIALIPLSGALPTPPLPPTPNSHQQRYDPSFHKSVSPTYITHKHIHAQTLMQACSISSFRSFFFSCLNTLYHSVPASPRSASALPLIFILPSSSLPLSPSLSNPLHFFSRRDVPSSLRSHDAKCLYVGVCYSVFVCLNLRFYTRASGGEGVNVFGGREGHVCEECANICPRALMCTHASLWDCVCVCVGRKGGNESGEEEWRGWRLWILHSMRIKATASPKVINLRAVLTTTQLLVFHISLTVCYLFNLHINPSASVVQISKYPLSYD